MLALQFHLFKCGQYGGQCELEECAMLVRNLKTLWCMILPVIYEMVDSLSGQIRI